MPFITSIQLAVLMAPATKDLECAGSATADFPSETIRVPVPHAGNLHNLAVHCPINSVGVECTVELLLNGAHQAGVAFNPHETGTKIVYFELPVEIGNLLSFRVKSDGNIQPLEQFNVSASSVFFGTHTP